MGVFVAPIIVSVFAVLLCWSTNSNSVTYPCQALRENLGSNEFVKILTGKPNDEEGESRKKTRYQIKAQWIGECLVNVYGRDNIKEWCGANRGHRFLEMPTTSCLTYTDFLLLDREQVYEEEYVLREGLSPEDKLLYNRFKKSKKGMSEEDTKR